MRKDNNQEFIVNYFKETKEILQKISIEDISRVIDILFKAWKRNSTIYVMGNGGSASTASHFAADLSKYATMGTAYNKRHRFKSMCLNDNIALTSAWTNDVGFDSIFSEQIESWVKKDDVIFAFSVHGGSVIKGANQYSQNIPRALKLAKKKGAILVGMAGDEGGVMKKISDACILVPTVNRSKITVHVEGFHVVIHHLIIHRLSELIDSWEKK